VVVVGHGSSISRGNGGQYRTPLPGTTPLPLVGPGPSLRLGRTDLCHVHSRMLRYSCLRTMPK
jgi:hypothetical protein